MIDILCIILVCQPERLIARLFDVLRRDPGAVQHLLVTAVVSIDLRIIDPKDPFKGVRVHKLPIDVAGCLYGVSLKILLLLHAADMLIGIKDRILHRIRDIFLISQIAERNAAECHPAFLDE